MTKAERVVWAAATMQAVVEAFDHIKKNEAAWRKSMPGRRPVTDREILARAIRAVEQSLGERTDCWPSDVQYKAAAKATREYLATFPLSSYWRRGTVDPDDDILHPDSTVAQRKPKDLKY